MSASTEITPHQLQRWRHDAVRLTYRELGEITGHHLRTWQKWCLGQVEPPQDIHILMDYVERTVDGGEPKEL